METEIDAPKAGATGELILALERLLADEYILLNKASHCLLDSSSPFAGETSPLFQTLHQQLKTNTEIITELLKRKRSWLSFSINDIISKTHLKNTSTSSSKVGTVEMLLDDHFRVIKQVDEVMEKFSVEMQSEEVLLLKQVREQHLSICSTFRDYLKELFNYNSKNLNRRAV